MKKIIISFTIFLFGSSILLAQHTETELVRSAFKLDKKAKVADFMQLSDSAAGIFWPIYNQYETERTSIGDRKVKLLDRYAAAYRIMDAATAESLWKESTSIQKAEAGLREKYAGIIRKKLSASAALNFYMIEDYINTSVKLELYNMIPEPSK
jgi:hypothetical protein